MFVWSDVVVMKHDSFTINKVWKFLDDEFAEIVHLPTVSVATDWLLGSSSCNMAPKASHHSDNITFL